MTAGIANPAAVYCEDQGGVLNPKETDKGTMTICIFDEGECEEWAYFRGECTPEVGNIALEACEGFEGASVCTEQYEPVCARMIDEDGVPVWKTFSNNCFACITGEVVFGYVSGECN